MTGRLIRFPCIRFACSCQQTLPQLFACLFLLNPGGINIPFQNRLCAKNASIDRSFSRRICWSPNSVSKELPEISKLWLVVGIGVDLCWRKAQRFMISEFPCTDFWSKADGWSKFLGSNTIFEVEVPKGSEKCGTMCCVKFARRIVIWFSTFLEFLISCTLLNFPRSPPFEAKGKLIFNWLILTGQIEANWLWSFLEERPKVSPTLCIYSGYRNEFVAMQSFLFESTLFTMFNFTPFFESEIMNLEKRVSKKDWH